MGRTFSYGSSPGFVGDHSSVVRLPGGRQIDFQLVSERRRSTAFVVKLAAAALAGAVALVVDPLAKAVKAGQLLFFGQAGEYARVTADSDAGEAGLDVEALPAALEDNDEAVVGGTGKKSVKAGTIVAQLASGKIIPRADVTGAETAIGFLASDATEDAMQDALTGYGVLIGGVFYEGLLPDRDEADFETWIGEINDAGPGVRLVPYSDSRAS
jgi:hypothetical protein